MHRFGERTCRLPMLLLLLTFTRTQNSSTILANFKQAFIKNDKYWPRWNLARTKFRHFAAVLLRHVLEGLIQTKPKGYHTFLWGFIVIFQELQLSESQEVPWSLGRWDSQVNFAVAILWGQRRKKRAKTSVQGTSPTWLKGCKSHTPNTNITGDGTKFNFSPTSSCLPVFVLANLHCQLNRI